MRARKNVESRRLRLIFAWVGHDTSFKFVVTSAFGFRSLCGWFRLPTPIRKLICIRRICPGWHGGAQGNAPLFPIGPVTGATRVPPPPTGSASPNAYSSPPTAFSPANTTVPALSNGLAESPSINGSVTSPNQVATNNFRSSLGGMQVIDLTGQPSLSNQAFGETSYGSNGLPIGSGLSVSPITPVNGSVALADVNAQGMAPSSALAGNSPVILRPIDTPPSASPIPRYRGIDSQFPGGASLTQLNVAPVRPAGGFANSDSWQSVQPAKCAGGRRRKRVAQSYP